MKFDCKVKVKHNYKNINSIIQKLPETVNESIEEVLKNIRGYAIKFEKGHNEEGILVEMVNMSTKEVKGRVYAKPEEFMTDDGQSYLWFEYFGTGQYAEKEHIGRTSHFIESGYTQWLIPLNKVEKSLNYPIITIKDSQFYLARGMKANHFLSDSEFYTREQNKEIVTKKLNQMIKECCK